MKTRILPIAILSLLSVACTEKKQGEAPDNNDTISAVQEIDNTATDPDTVVPADRLANERPAEGDEVTVSGEVFEINQGKDGYSAKIKSSEGKSYIATISIPNMTNPKDYRAVKKGDKITVTGIAYPVEEDVMIKVTKLH